MEHYLIERKTKRVIKRSKHIGNLFEVQDQMIADGKADSYNDFEIVVKQ